MTRDLFQNVVIEINALESVLTGEHKSEKIAFHENDPNYVVLCNHLESIYNQAVNMLILAADRTIPKLKRNHFKHWWNSEASNLKQLSIKTHREWVENDRPGKGPIYEAKRIAKNNYKNCLRQNQDIVKDSVSNDSHEALLQKIMVHFGRPGMLNLEMDPNNQK